jgi:transcriptional regulator with XRE-family HTH domain|tara:strand:+ start:440 stop:793 length:354 start_codon:yes stop_codon:yes gene_type:complete
MSRTPIEIFSERLKTARELCDFNQGELAKRSGLQVSAISHFETNKRKPSFENLRKLADALNVTTDYLLGRVDDPHDLGTADRLHRHIDKLTQEDKDFAEDMLKSLAERAESRRRKED